jgi:serine protease Do
MRSPSLVWSALIFLCLLFLPALPAHAEETLPLERIGVARLRSGVLPGVVVGGHYEGVLKILQTHYTAQGYLDEAMETAARRLMEQELLKAGYTVAQSQPQSVFADHLMDEIEPPRFLIGGTITQTHLNTYDSWFDRTTEDQRTIWWEVFDREANRVIASQETTGTGRVSGVDNPAATYEAIKDSFRGPTPLPPCQTPVLPSPQPKLPSMPSPPWSGFGLHRVGAAAFS